MFRTIELLARTMAIIGGLVLVALILLICTSVLGRGLNTFAHWDAIESAAPGVSNFIIEAGIGPVQGDFEILEAGIAFAIFSFLPLCQLRSGHATVDVFTSFLSPAINIWLRAFWEVCLSATILLITWRLALGLLDKFGNGETTYILAFPVWWAFGLSFCAACVASIVAVYCGSLHVRAAVKGELLILSDRGVPE